MDEGDVTSSEKRFLQTSAVRVFVDDFVSENRLHSRCLGTGEVNPTISWLVSVVWNILQASHPQAVSMCGVC